MKFSLRSVPFVASLSAAVTGGGGPPPDDFPPAYLPGVTTRWVADSLDGSYTDGASVTSWPSVSGAVAATFTNEAKVAPIYKRGGVNSHSYVNFSATNMGMQSTTVNVGSEFTMFIVATVETLLGGGGQRTVQGIGGNWLFGPYGNAWKCFNGTNFSDSLAASAGQLVSAFIVSTGGFLHIWMNGVYYNSKGGSGAYGTALGLSGGGAYSEPWVGRLHEIIVYEHPDFGLGGTVYPYLNTKYGVT